MQPETELFQRCILAVAIGLLIGVERGWQAREAKDGGRVAGIRTFTLIAILGGVCGLLSADGGASLLGLSFIAFALPYGLFEWRHARLTQTVSATSFVAGLLTFALGAYAMRGNMAIAAAGGVVTAVILAERQILHAFLRNLKWIELRDGLILLIMTVILLPALPDRTIDPWRALNPHDIWLMTVLAGTVCYGGYIAVRFAGKRRGLLYAGIMGGITTSTTVTWTYAQLVRKDPQLQPTVTTAILAAWIVSLIRMTAIAAVLAPQVALVMIPPLAASAAVFLVGALVSYRAAGQQEQSDMLLLNDPLELSLILRAGAVLALIMLISKWVSAYAGTGGLVALGGVSGMMDVDPITLSMSQQTRTGLPISTAAAAILTAAATNGVAKSLLALGFGGWRLGLVLSTLTFAALGVGAWTFFA